MKIHLMFSLLMIAGSSCNPVPDPCRGSILKERAKDGVLRPILYLDERGCIACSRRFAHLCETYYDATEVQLVLRATGAQVDISAFIGPDDKRVKWDDDGSVAQCLGLQGSSAIFFASDGSVDTIVTVGAKTLDQDFDYILSRLPSQAESLPRP